MPIKPVFDPKLIVSDASALQKWQADPLVSRGKATAAYFVNMMAEMEKLQADCKKPNLKQLDTPALMMWGTSDKVVSEEGNKEVIRLFRADFAFNTYDEGFHNLINGLNFLH
mmetsp:Transcript_2025/g.4573  ORF Transcript_2025/g.4573 Transcript_2025/m.4573 type:complete len:112 (-) Transcript_2025:418-753(-)